MAGQRPLDSNKPLSSFDNKPSRFPLVGFEAPTDLAGSTDPFQRMQTFETGPESFLFDTHIGDSFWVGRSSMKIFWFTG